MALVTIAMAMPAGAQATPVPPGFSSMIDGKTLAGWSGDYFNVENGVLTAGSDKRIPKNTFLIFDRPYADFELRYRYRWASENGNSGIQFRSGIAEGHFAMAGMQANLTPLIDSTERFAMSYEELGDRAEMVLLGQKARISRRAAGRGGRDRIVRTVLATTNPRARIIEEIRPYPEWNEVVLIAHGERIVHVINGLVAFDATDSDPLGKKDGLIGILVHAGAPMSLQIGDMVIRPLTRLPDLSRFATKPGPAPAPAVTDKDSTKVAMHDQPLP